MDLRDTLKAYEVEGEGDRYQTANEYGYDTATELLHSGILGFCGCGNPEANLRYVLGGLELIDEKPGLVPWNVWWPKHKARELAHYGSEGAARFFHYWCADPDTAERRALTEHGGSIPGWLTAEGRTLLGLLREWSKLPEAQDG